MRRKDVALLALVAAVALLVINPARLSAATGDLPPRPTAVPTATPESTPPAPMGGSIRLTTDGPTAGLWTAAQWQDGTGDWHTVAGWQGPFGPYGFVGWWFSPRDVGTGPFRWLILAGPGGDVLAVSDPFDIPGHREATLQVHVTMGSRDLEEETGIMTR
jgi:hypothetical protein